MTSFNASCRRARARSRLIGATLATVTVLLPAECVPEGFVAVAVTVRVALSA